MGLRKAKKYFVAHVVARVVYLFAATIMCVGMIMDVIMSVNILLPYLHVNHYINTSCVNHNTTIYNLDAADCEGTPGGCERVNTKTRPCLQIFVTYEESSTPALLRRNEYNVLSDDICSLDACAAFYWQNLETAQQFKKDYGTPGQRFECLYDPTDKSSVIAEREHSEMDVMHALLWPSLCIVVGLILVAIFYCWVGCGIWGSRIATVMWDKSLKRIEMEQEIRRRTNNNSHRKSFNT